ncbi:MAG TPA: hypothetical protein VNL74_09775 [Methylococcus sp.]|nr:hypothetical protein [Methylococcus sp.]
MVLALKIMVGLSALYLIVGLIQPKWVLFWMKRPDRLTASAIALLLFMGSWTGLAKLTLKPKEPQQRYEEQRKSRDEQNILNLGR